MKSDSRRVALARLEHERVPGGDRDRVHPHRHHDREVERGDPRADPERLAERVGVHVGGHLLGKLALEQGRDARGEFDHLQAADHFALGVGEHLAVLVGDQPGQLVQVAFDEVTQGEHDPGPADERHVPPLVEGLRRRRDRGVDVGRGRPARPGPAARRSPGCRPGRTGSRPRSSPTRRSSAGWYASEVSAPLQVNAAACRRARWCAPPNPASGRRRCRRRRPRRRRAGRAASGPRRARAPTGSAASCATVRRPRPGPR